jgi:acyl-CoA thioester hydrolase|tara:strand:- start:4176 stop:4649 length:474 start_codon:yes stop_codon:yes gene_type:complete
VSKKKNEIWGNNDSSFYKGEHYYILRVYYEDTDAAGIVYYANYLKFAERARTEMIRGLGVEHGQLMSQNNAAFAVRSCEVDYMKPAMLDDKLSVITNVNSIAGASIKLSQRVVFLDNDYNETELVRLKLRLACLDKRQRPMRIPIAVRDAIATINDL